MYKHPNLRPSKEHIRIAEACLSRVPVGLLNEISTYRIHYCLTQCDVYFWENKYREAIAFAESKLVDSHILKLLKKRLDLLAKLEAA